MSVPGIHNLALKNTQRGGRHRNSAETKLNKARACFGSAEKQNHGTIVERYLEDKQYQERMHEQGYTQTDIEEFDRVASKCKMNLLLLLTNGRILQRPQ